MNTFIFGNYAYENPIFTIKANTPEELPEAFEQLEKLRRSGYLLGFMRYEALIPKDMGAPLLHFTLYRRRRELANTEAKVRTFCPSIEPANQDEALTALYEKACTQYKDVALSTEFFIATRADGRAIFESLKAQSQYPAYFKDAFEELLFFPKHRVFTITRETYGKPEQIFFDAETREDAQFLIEAATPLFHSLTEISPLSYQAILRDKVSIPELFSSFVPQLSTRGKEGTKDVLLALENRNRGIYAGIMGLFSAEESTILAAEQFFEKRPQETVFRLGVGVRTQETDSAQAFCEAIRHKVQELILPKDFCLTDQVRVEKGAGLLLSQTLGRLLSLASSRAIQSKELEKVLAACSSPVEHSSSDPRFAAPWEKVALPIAEDFTGILSFSLTAKGEFSFTSSNLPPKTAQPVLVFSRRSLNEQDDFLGLPSANQESGESFDTIHINRLSFVAGCTRHALIIEKNGELLTTPESAGAYQDSFCKWLLEQAILKEQSLSLHDLLQAEKVYCVNTVDGVVQVDIQKPQRRASV